MRCAIGQAPKRLYISSILSAVAIAIFGGLDLRMAAIILLFLFFVLSCEMMACFSTPRKISMEMVCHLDARGRRAADDALYASSHRAV